MLSMVRGPLPCLAALIAFSASIAPAAAQDIRGSAPAFVSRVDGSATLERDGRPDSAPLNMPVIAGDRLRTADGRLEIAIDVDEAIDVDRASAIEYQSSDLVRLIDGAVRLRIGRPARTAAFRVDSPAGSIRVTEPGDYRVALLRSTTETQLELAVLHGAADIFTAAGETHVDAGQRAYASAGLLPSYAEAFDPSAADDLDRWSEASASMRPGISAQYLPPDVKPYSTMFDEYGDWQYQQPYGYVWYPRVSQGWRPYLYGRWVSYPRYGWTWIGTDGFAWPTHHYGRWGVAGGAWFWIPASRWAPAYVSWAYAPGYVSWCPLGFDNRPAIAIGFTAGPRFYSAWNAWTVVAASHFGRGYVPERVVRASTWSAGARPVFQMRSTAPDARDVAVPRYVNRGDTIVESQTARPAPPARVVSGDVAIRSRTPPGAIARSRVVNPGRSGSVPGARTVPPVVSNTGPARAIERTAPAYAPNYAPNYRPNYTPNYRPTFTPNAAPNRPAAASAMPPSRAVPRAGAAQATPAPAPAAASPPARAGAAPRSGSAPASAAPRAGGGRGGRGGHGASR